MALMKLADLVNGTTFNEIRNAFHLKNDMVTMIDQFNSYLEAVYESKGDAQLMIANRIYMPQDSQDIVLKNFSSYFEYVDFEEANDTAQAINSVVNETTNGKITDIVKPLDLYNGADSILINAITIKSRSEFETPWKKTSVSVDEDNTNNTLKHAILTGGKLDIGMVFTGRVPIAELKDLGARAARLDFRNSSFSMILVVPTNIEFSTLESRIKNYSLSRINDQMDNCKRRKCSIFIQKLKLVTELHLNDILKKVFIFPNHIIRIHLISVFHLFSRWALLICLLTTLKK